MRTAMLVLAWAVMVMTARGDDREGNSIPAKAERISNEARQEINSDEPMSIYNEDLRKFKFKMEHELVGLETAQYVMESFRKENPGIIGIYPDVVTNSLVFIAAPEAEPAIRKALANRIIELQGIPDDFPAPLGTQKAYLQKQRVEQLARLARLECQFVGLEDQPKVVERFELLMNEAEQELKIIERKIEVVNKYIKRLDEGPR